MQAERVCEACLNESLLGVALVAPNLPPSRREGGFLVPRLKVRGDINQACTEKGVGEMREKGGKADGGKDVVVISREKNLMQV